MSALFSPVISIMLRAVRRSSKGLARDFNEIRCLQSSRAAAGEFAKAAYVRSGKIISEELQTYKQGCDVMLEGADAVPQESSNLFWFVSPIDSRTNFMKGLPYFVTSIALVKDDEVVASVVDAPVLRETYYADQGLGTFAESCQSRYVRMHVTKRENMNSAVVDFTAVCPDAMSLATNLLSQNVVLRSMGSVVLGFSYVSAACYDMAIYSGVSKYKAGICKLFVEGSKGSVVQKNGLLMAGSLVLCDFVERNFLQ
ncbi:MAG: inositol monophosphatase family protein [Anaplasma sp.]